MLGCPCTGGSAFTCPVSATRASDGMKDGRCGGAARGQAACREELGLWTAFLQHREMWGCPRGAALLALPLLQARMFLLVRVQAVKRQK